MSYVVPERGGVANEFHYPGAGNDLQSVACTSVTTDQRGDGKGPSSGTTAGFTAAGRLRDGPQSAAWRFPQTLSDVRAVGTYGMHSGGRG